MRTYPIRNGDARYPCLTCGVPRLSQATHLCQLVIGEHRLHISGEHLLRPERYICQVLSTSALTLDMIRRVGDLYCNIVLDRTSPGRMMGAVK